MKLAIVFCLLFLASSIYGQCVITSSVSAFASADASCQSSSGCQLSATLIGNLVNVVSNPSCAVNALLGGVNLVIAPSGSGSLNLQLGSNTITYTSLNITANPGVVIHAIASTSITIAQNLYLYGSAALNVTAGTVVTVQGSVTVQAQATVNVAGNLTANTAMTVQGTVYFAGSQVSTSAQTAWVVLLNTASSISISGSASASAYVRGNGGFDASVTFSGNATIAAGNSPGTVFVSGNLNLDPSTTLEIDVDSLTSYDRLLIQKNFKRDGILYAHFENNYVPNNGDGFVFATHSSASGQFSLSHGNYDLTTFKNVHPHYFDQTTTFTYSSASSVAASLLFFLVCTFVVIL